MYKFRRMRALLLALVVMRPSWRALAFRWSWTLLQCILAGAYIAALVVRSSYDQMVNWHDIRTLDAFARGFLLSSYIALAAGCYFAASIANVVNGLFRGGYAQTVSPPGTALALRQAARARDPRIAPLAQEQPSAEGADPSGSGPITDASLVVSLPEILTRPLVAVVAEFFGALIFLLLTAWIASVAVSAIPQPGASPDTIPRVGFIYGNLSPAGVFLTASALTFAATCRSWSRWRSRSQGITVTIDAVGLAIRDAELDFRATRYIPWRDVQTVARIAYNDTFLRTRIVYMLDAGDQTFLWESPPDMRYASPSSRTQIMQRQTNAARLAARIVATTGVPLLDLSRVVNEIARIEPDLSPVNMTISDGGDVMAIEVTPSDADIAMLKFLLSAAPDRAAPRPTLATRLEQWRRLLDGALTWFAIWAAGYWFLATVVASGTSAH